MNRTILGTFLIFSIFSAAAGFGQTATVESVAPVASATLIERPGDQEGPDHAIYKKGYDLVLDEKWDAARKQFAELLGKYPKSNYVDDARYWSAYALMHTDLKKALTTYKEFVNQYPKSTYYDDAVADIANIQAQLEIATAVNSAVGHKTGSWGGVTPVPTVAPQIYTIDSKMRHLNRSMRLMNRRFSSGFAYSPVPVPVMIEENKLDEKTRLKLDALQAIGENTEDEKGFATLKQVALDVKQPLVLRKEALRQLSQFKNQDVDALYMDLVRKDTSAEIQVIAIENIGESGQDKNKTVQTLEELYSSLPAHREDQRAAALYRVADIGNDRAVDFLTKVAKTDSSYDLRSDAVYYLGNIGGEKARAVLYDILKGE
jgi:tetratricopeptide (TPR) repeat protein